MPSIRYHTKSRHGCFQCKQRKVKCDETRPRCQRCTARHSLCSLQDNHGLSDRSLAPVATEKVVRSTRTRLHRSDDCPSKAPRFSINIGDLEWYHHFTLDTAPSLSFDEDTLEIWSRDIPLLASTSPSLLHCLCALGALHKLFRASTNSEHRRCITAATCHQNQALTLYVPILNNASTETCTLVVCFNLVFQVLPYAWRACLGFNSEELASDKLYFIGKNAIDAFVDTIKYWRGTTAIFNQYSSFIQTSSVAKLFTIPDLDSLPDLSTAVARTFEILFLRLTQVTGKPPEYTRILESEITRLRCSARCSVQKRWLGFMWSFVTEMDPLLVTLLEHRDSLALAILRVWTTCLNGPADRLWWIRGWSKALSDEITSALGPEWEDTRVQPTSAIVADPVISAP